MASIGDKSHVLEHALTQNAPVIITSSGLEMTAATDPWGKVTGSGKYEQVAYDNFTLLPDGSIDSSVKEFCVAPYASGLLLFNDPLIENAFIEYEAGPSGYYIHAGLDLDPIKSGIDSGFINIGQERNPENIYISTSQSSLHADGSQFAKLTVTLSDYNFDPIPNKSVMFELRDLYENVTGLGFLSPTHGSINLSDPSGYILEVSETTDSLGKAYAKFYVKDGYNGRQTIRAYSINASGINDEVEILTFYIRGVPFTLDESELGSLDYLL